MKMSKTTPSTTILELFPHQGEWRAGDYFALPGNRMVELVRGHVEVLPMPSLLHQFLARLLFLQMHEFVDARNLGIVMTAPTRVRIDALHFREPDVLFVAKQNQARRHEQYWEVIDIAIEIVSPDDLDRDLIDKRDDYACAGIPEYWIVDPRDDSIQVLQLADGSYRETDSECHSTATSIVLDGFSVDVAELFREARAK